MENCAWITWPMDEAGLCGIVPGPPTEWPELVQAHDEPDELTVIDIPSV